MQYFIQKRLAIGCRTCYTIDSEREITNPTKQTSSPGAARAEREKIMKVKSFLNKFVYASSSIKYVFLYSPAGHEIILSASTLKENDHREELNSSIETFKINNERIVIYCK